MNRHLAMGRDGFVGDLIGIKHLSARQTIANVLISDSTHRLLVALWPCPTPTPPGALPLRAFIERILRTSSATYATLLAACYYLNLLQSMSLNPNPTAAAQPEILTKTGSIQCPRRMFLAAIMLGWKYTQEKSYSSRAWARISGLHLKEINSNEVMFLVRIDWRLYISCENLERWSVYVRLPTWKHQEFIVQDPIPSSV